MRTDELNWENFANEAARTLFCGHDLDKRHLMLVHGVNMGEAAGRVSLEAGRRWGRTIATFGNGGPEGTWCIGDPFKDDLRHVEGA